MSLSNAKHPGGNADRRLGIFEHGVILSDDAGGEFWQDLGEASEDALALIDRNVVRDDGAEGKDVEAAVGLDRHKQLER